jgi:transcriptional regulator with XRE-family HTH domain
MSQGERLRALRNLRGFHTVASLSRATDIDKATLSLNETDKRPCTVANLVILARTLEVSTDYLLGEEDCDITVEDAVVRQSYRIFLRQFGDSIENDILSRLAERVSLPRGPRTVQEWKAELQTQEWLSSSSHKGPRLKPH